MYLYVSLQPHSHLYQIPILLLNYHSLRRRSQNQKTYVWVPIFFAECMGYSADDGEKKEEKKEPLFLLPYWVALPCETTAAARASLPIPTNVCSSCVYPDNGMSACVWDVQCAQRGWCTQLHSGAMQTPKLTGREKSLVAPWKQTVSSPPFKKCSQTSSLMALWNWLSVAYQVLFRPPGFLSKCVPWNSSQYCAWICGPTLYQWGYSLCP